jgi:NitT/TauT family transport system substrate-binding protein
VRVGRFLAAFVLLSAAANVQAAPVRVAYSAISGAMAPLWTAQEGGYFRREGLEAEILYIPGGSLVVQAMIGGDLQFAFGPSVPVINAALRGADLALVANTGNSLVFSIYARPNIREPRDLKGKKIAVTRLAGSTDQALDIVLSKWSLQRGRDVTVLQTGGMPESVAGLSSGAFDAVVLSPPNTLRARKLGMRELVDIGQMGVAFPNTPLSTSRATLRANRDMALSFMRGFLQGLYRLRADREFSTKVLARYTKTGDPEILHELYEIYGVRYAGDPIPYVRSEGVEGILRKIDSKEARQARAADFIDHSLLKELEQAGFFRALSR